MVFGCCAVIFFGVVLDNASDTASVDGDGAALLDDTARAAAEDVAHEAAAIDGDLGIAHTSHVDPVLAMGGKLFHIALATAVDVAGAGVVQSAEGVDDGPGPFVDNVVLGAELIGGAVVGVVVDEELGVAGVGVIDVVVGVEGTGAVGANISIGIPPAHRGHLGTGVDVGHDAGIAMHLDIGVHDASGHDVGGVLGVALTAAEDVADGVVVVYQDGAVGGADGGEIDDDIAAAVGAGGTLEELFVGLTVDIGVVYESGLSHDKAVAADVDEGGAVVCGVVAADNHEGVDKAVDVDTGTGQSAAADDGALDAATGHFDVGVALDTAGGVVDVLGVAAAADDAAVVLFLITIVATGGADYLAGADVGASLDECSGVAEDMAVGAAAEGGAIDEAAVDGETGAVDVTIYIEVAIGVVADTLTGAVDVATQLCAVETGAADDGGAADGDVAEAVVPLGGVVEIFNNEAVASGVVVSIHVAHGGHVAATVDVLVDVAASDGDVGVAVDAAGYHGAGGVGLEVAGAVVEAGVVLVIPELLGAIAAAEDGAVAVIPIGSHRGGSLYGGADGGCAADIDVGVLCHHALLGTAIDVAHDADVAADVDVGLT